MYQQRKAGENIWKLDKNFVRIRNSQMPLGAVNNRLLKFMQNASLNCLALIKIDFLKLDYFLLKHVNNTLM